MLLGALRLLALVLLSLPARLQAGSDPPLDLAASYPEGPTVVGGTLYWAEMPTDRIRRHRNGDTTSVWQQPRCGPTSIKPDGRGGFWILCHLGHAVLRLDGKFQPVARIERDQAGNRLSWPNDAAVDSRGRLYLTSSGVFDLAAPAEGAVYFIDLDDRAQRLVGGLRYANGIQVVEKRSVLYVSEHLNRRVHAFDLSGPGKLGKARVFFDLNALPLPKSGYPLAGPDGLLLHPSGSIYVAEYGAGRVFVVSPAGTLQRVIKVPMQFVTNFAYWHDQVVVTGAFRNDIPEMPGRVITLPK